jgi:hypothetical protein
MRSWLRVVVPDLFLAAVVALLVTVAMQHLDGAELERIRSDTTTAAADGLTLDEHFEVIDSSVRRSTLVHLPILIALSGVVVGLACRNRSWAWLTALGSVLPALIMGVAFFIDSPIPAGALTSAYTLLAVAMSLAGTALRQRLTQVGASVRRKPNP